jgi:TPR repeat protein
MCSCVIALNFEEASMQHHERGHIGGDALGAIDAGELFQLGLSCTIGCSVPVDLVSAHKWFNLAAMRGNHEAIRLRHEIAAEMSEREIIAAQRAARDWATKH